MSSLEIEIERGKALSPRLAAAWDDLVLRSTWASPTILHGYQEAWWRHQGRACRRETISAWRGGRLVGLLPLAVQQGPAFRAGRVPGQGWGLHDGVVVDPAAGDDVARALLAAVAELDVDYLCWHGLRDGAPAERAYRGQGGLRITGRHAAPVLEIDGPIEDVLRRRPGRKVMAEVARRGRRLAELGVVTIETADTTETVAAAIPVMFDLHARRWTSLDERGRVDRSPLRSELGRAMVRDTLLAIAPTGVVRLLILRIDDRPLAFRLAYQMGGWLVCDRHGFDPEFAKQGPGLQVIVAAIRAAAAEGVTSVNLGQGDDPYKRHFVDRDAAVHQAAIGVNGRRGRLAAATSVSFWTRRRALAAQPRVHGAHRLVMRCMHQMRML